MKIFLDANVLFSASNPDSAMETLLGLLREEHTLCASAYAVTEASRNIRNKRPQWTEHFETLQKGVLLCPHGKLDVGIEIVEKDRPILASAIAGQCDYLVTGDRKDFGHLFGKSVQGVKVVSPAQLAEALL